MRIALCQLNYTIGDFENNTRRIIEQIKKAKSESVDLAIFSELCVCGYPPLDFLEFNDFIKKSRLATEEIARECNGIMAIVGFPEVNPVAEGKNLFNAAAVLSNGKIVDVIYKSLLPTYDIFDEYRYFEPGKNAHCVTIGNVKIALTVCEDLWNLDDDPLYINSPMD